MSHLSLRVIAFGLPSSPELIEATNYNRPNPLKVQVHRDSHRSGFSCVR